MSAKTTHEYFNVTRKYSRGTFMLMAIIMLVGAAPFIYQLLRPQKGAPPAIDKALSSLQSRQLNAEPSGPKDFSRGEANRYHKEGFKKSYGRKENSGTLFYFDPNSLTAQEWKKLGVRDKTIAVISNYRSKGGRFRHPDDIKKIWGLFPDEAERLLPFVRILPANTAQSYESKSEYQPIKKTYHRQRKEDVVININEADSTAWISLPGIGSKLALRIINFRDKLGGFYSVEQVAETFGLPDSVFQKIRPLLKLTGGVKKININTAELEEFKAHPYIRYNLGKALVEFRKQHGVFKEIGGVKKSMVFSEDIFLKVKPYLSVE